MECVTPTVSFDMLIDNCFTSLFLLTHLELTTFQQQLYATKIGYANALALGTNSCKKGNVTIFNSAAHI